MFGRRFSFVTGCGRCPLDRDRRAFNPNLAARSLLYVVYDNCPGLVLMDQE